MDLFTSKDHYFINDLTDSFIYDRNIHTNDGLTAAANYNKKILDLQRRYDAQYDVIAEAENQIEDVEKQIQSIRQEKISADNIYKLLLAFDELYQSATEMERKEFMRAFIEKIEIYPEKRKDGCRVRNIVFNFPVPVNGEDVVEYSLESLTTLETVCLLVRRNGLHIDIDVDVEEMLQEKRGTHRDD